MTNRPDSQPSVEENVRLEGALHVLRFALDRFIRIGFKPAPEYLRDLIDKVTDDPGEPCDRDRQYARAEAAEAALDRVRALHRPADYRGLTICADCSGFDGLSCDNSPCGYEQCPTLAALVDPVREQQERPTHPDGTPYSYYEITAEGWGFCRGCGLWSTATPERPHECSEARMKGPVVGTAHIALDVQAGERGGGDG